MIYPQLNAPKRTDEKFRSGIYSTHTKVESILLKLPIDIVKDVPIADGLHIVDLGKIFKMKGFST